MAEDDLEFTRRRTLVHKRGVIVGICKGGRASVLKEIRVARRLTRLWTVEMVPTAQLIRTQSLTPAFASHNRTMTSWRAKLQPFGTCGEQICTTADDGAYTFAFMRCNRQGNVETVNKADAVRGEVILTVVDGELSQCSWGCTSSSVTLEFATTVAGDTGEPVVDGGASGSGPNTAGPVRGWGWEGLVC